MHSFYNIVYQYLPHTWIFARHRWIHRRAIDAWKKSPVVFIHIPKAAGTSLNRALGMPDLGHLTYRELYACDPNSFDESKKYIAVIRNPIERLRSTYHYVRKMYVEKGRTALIGMAKCQTFSDFVQTYIADSSSISHYFLRPQSDYIDLVPDRTLALAHFERLDEAATYLSEWTGRDLTLDHLNVSYSSKQRAEDELPDQLICDIKSIYADDFQLHTQLSLLEIPIMYR